MRFAARIWTWLLDLLFPIECLGCKVEGQWLCKPCQEAVPIEAHARCIVCKELSAGGQVCFLCRKNSNLTGVIWFFDYDVPLVRRALQAAKYQYVKDALSALLEVARPYVTEKLEVLSIDPRAAVWVPVPLHPRKRRERGFNQSEQIAKTLAEEVGTRIVCVLRRRGWKVAQALLDEFDRLRNLRDAFVCSDPSKVKGQYVFLVDDVTTTGATLQECAKTLKNAGAQEVWGLVLAKG